MKKLNKLFAVLVALAMMATLCVSMAFAADTAPGNGKNQDGTVTETDKKDKDALISKYLKVNDGTSVPDATFTFQFTAQDSDTTTAAATPNIANYVWKTAGDNKNMGTTAASDGNSVAGVVKVADLVTNNGTLIFTEPGEYIYKVKEISGVLDSNNQETKTDAATGITEKLTNDKTTEYTIRIYVKYSGETLVIDTITIAAPDGTKLDPKSNPVTEDDFDPDGTTKDGATIVNNYEKKKDINDITEPETPPLTKDNAVLEISKTVSAKDGYATPGQEFPFTIVLTKPADNTTEGEATSVKAYKIKGSDKEEITINYGSTDFTLEDGEALCFDALPYGAKYEVKERLNAVDNQNKEIVVNHDNYTASATWSDGEAINGAAKGAPIEIKTGTVSDNQSQEAVDVTNTLDTKDVTPTGILISNLPYIALALVAIGGLVAYVVVRRRQSDEA